MPDSSSSLTWKTSNERKNNYTQRKENSIAKGNTFFNITINFIDIRDFNGEKNNKIAITFDYARFVKNSTIHFKNRRELEDRFVEF
jgi:hypothetical protein